ncbi:hypothetical protein [Pandoraea sp. NPDC087047]|uniref:hypothetical protein n=1 Tax=Pandoraea sp. NPDC087047 TaxID=3364390 RepID=UPI003808237D
MPSTIRDRSGANPYVNQGHDATSHSHSTNASSSSSAPNAANQRAFTDPAGMPGGRRPQASAGSARPRTAPAQLNSDAATRQYLQNLLTRNPRTSDEGIALVNGLLNAAEAGQMTENQAMIRCNALRDMFAHTGTRDHIEAMMHAYTHRPQGQQDPVLFGRAADLVYSQGWTPQQAAEYIGASHDPAVLHQLGGVAAQRDAAIAQRNPGLSQYYQTSDGDDSPFQFN